MKSGVYTITSPTGRVYVGSTNDFRQRKASHVSALRRGIHTNPKLQASANKHGVDSLVFRPIICAEGINIVMYEQIAMDALRPDLNISLVAGSNWSRRGEPKTDAHRAKIGAALRGRKYPGRGAVVAAALTGRRRSTEAVAKHRATCASKRAAKVPAA